MDAGSVESPRLAIAAAMVAYSPDDGLADTTREPAGGEVRQFSVDDVEASKVDFCSTGVTLELWRGKRFAKEPTEVAPVEGVSVEPALVEVCYSRFGFTSLNLRSATFLSCRRTHLGGVG